MSVLKKSMLLFKPMVSLIPITGIYVILYLFKMFFIAFSLLVDATAAVLYRYNFLVLLGICLNDIRYWEQKDFCCYRRLNADCMYQLIVAPGYFVTYLQIPLFKPLEIAINKILYPTLVSAKFPKSLRSYRACRLLD